MSTAVVLLTRDLRLHDNPALHAAVDNAEHVVPLFVVDDGIRRTAFNRPNRARFLADCLADLDAALRRRGGALVVRRGDVVAETVRITEAVDGTEVHCAADYSRYATGRQRRLAAALGRRPLLLHHSHVAVHPGALVPSGRDHYAVFSAYHRRWSGYPVRPVLPAPDRVRLPPGLEPDVLPNGPDICAGSTSPDLPPGGERAARRKAQNWFDGPLSDYGGQGRAGPFADGHDDLGRDGTSRLSPYLHFGCLSAADLVDRADRRHRGTAAFLRQLAWRDFFHQVLAARPAVRDADYRTRSDRWREDPEALAAWRAGRTGFPLVDAGMRQLGAEGWMHNRARLVAASFLTKHLYLDWRTGAQHFFDLLVDGDVANNSLNWQWVAGTGTDTRPNRVLNPLRQAERYDAQGSYVTRWVPEIGTPDYPAPIVDHRAAVAAFRAARGA